jgi:hypothetical protein
MKKIKYLLLFISIFASVFQSCSNSEDTIATQKSSALRIFLNEIKLTNNISGKSANTNSDMCFEFVFPLTLSYSNGNTVSVLNQEEIINILENETSELYINAIAFPFDILVSGSTTPVTITTEAAFWDVINNCDIETYDDYAVSGPCYSFVYPFSLINSNNETIVINNDQDIFTLFQDENENNFIVDFVYPFSVNYDNTIVQINNQYEFSEMNNNCNDSNCICPQVFDPVCVNVGGVVINFPNACVAECAGYTAADFVNCN